MEYIGTISVRKIGSIFGTCSEQASEEVCKHVSCRLGENTLCVENQVQDLTINGNYHKQKQCLAELSFKYEKLNFNSIDIFVCQHLYVGDFRKH